MRAIVGKSRGTEGIRRSDRIFVGIRVDIIDATHLVRVRQFIDGLHGAAHRGSRQGQ